MTESREWILSYLNQYLCGEEGPLEPCEWDEVLGEMKRHGVISFLEPLHDADYISDEVRERIKKEATQTARQNYRLLFLTKYLVRILKEQKIPVVVLKGVATSAFYPLPEMRKSGDVDLLICDSSQWEKAEEVLRKHHFVRGKDQHSLHHIVMHYEGDDRVLSGIDIEVHGMLSEPLDAKKANHFIEKEMAKISGSTKVVKNMGEPFPTLSEGHHAFYLLLHMYQHFSRAGFGLKLLCDWVIFWNRNISAQEKERYLNCVQQSGLQRFSDLVTSICVAKLGLESEQVREIWQDSFSEDEQDLFWEEIWSAEEFGGGETHRMVLLRGTGLLALVREFHHQMHLNYPWAGKCGILWPALWLMTLARFMRNNKKVRGQSGLEVIRMARKRGEMIKKLELFSGKK